ALNGLSTIGPTGFVFVSQAKTATTESFTIVFGGTLASLPQTLIAPAITSGSGTVSASNIVIGGAPNGNFVTVGNNSQLQLNSIAGISVPNALKLFGPGVGSDGSLFNASGNNTWAGTITMGSNSNFDAAPFTTLTVSGAITDSGSPFNVNKM